MDKVLRKTITKKSSHFENSFLTDAALANHSHT